MSAPLLIAVLSLLFAAAAIGAVVSCFFRLKTTEAQSAAAQKSLREELQLYNSAAAGLGRETTTVSYGRKAAGAAGF